ncbi:uncharacterized protein LOC135826708 [Sycon ciliatum]|uniref:uncharacterized protein LOC135826708 n=1 Tax=Sycon ciliatum TaxID=27933 RepID=UPI0031F70158
MRIYKQPATFSAAHSECASIGMKILRYKAHKLRKDYQCFMNIKEILLDSDISDIWLLNPRRMNESAGTLHLNTSLAATSHQSENATQPFICATKADSILCGGYNMRLYTQPATFSSAVSQCNSIGMKILRQKAHKLRKHYPCFMAITDFLLHSDISDIWLVNPRRMNESASTLHLETGVANTTSHQSETAKQPFICAKDRNECEDSATTCRPGTYCRNMKGGYKCQREFNFCFSLP